MKTVRHFLSVIRRDDEAGQALVEYAFAIGFVALICISGLQKLSGSTNIFYTNLATSLSTVS